MKARQSGRAGQRTLIFHRSKRVAPKNKSVRDFVSEDFSWCLPEPFLDDHTPKCKHEKNADSRFFAVFYGLMVQVTRGKALPSSTARQPR
jgi:hypothetical protein